MRRNPFATGAPPGPPLREFIGLPRPSSWIEGRSGEGRVEEGPRECPQDEFFATPMAKTTTAAAAGTAVNNQRHGPTGRMAQASLAVMVRLIETACRRARYVLSVCHVACVRYARDE